MRVGMNGRACETMWFAVLPLPERVLLPLFLPRTHVYPKRRAQRLRSLSSTAIKPTGVWKSQTPRTTRCCTYLPGLYRTLIATAFSSPSTQRPHRKEQEKCPTRPRIYMRVLLCYLYFTELSRRKDTAFPLQILSIFSPFFFPFLRDPECHL